MERFWTGIILGFATCTLMLAMIVAMLDGQGRHVCKRIYKIEECLAERVYYPAKNYTLTIKKEN